MTEPVFRRDGEAFLPTEHAAGPWDPRYLHGGAVSGLVARTVEAHPFERPMRCARSTLELVRPVPRQPLEVDVRPAEGGANIARLDVTVSSDATVVARASTVFVREQELAHEPLVAGDEDPPPVGDGVERRFPMEVSEDAAFHRTGMDVRFVGGGFDRPGPATAWFELRRPLVDGEEATPLQLLAAAADFGNGISWSLPPDRFVFINPDLTVHLARPPVGSRVALDAVTIGEARGFAMAESALFDERGRVGRSVQSLFVDDRR